MRTKPGRLAGGCIAATLVVVGAAAAGSSPASSATDPCAAAAHCAAVIDGGANQWSQDTAPVYISEESATLEADCLAVLNESPSRWADWEIWAETNITSDKFPVIRSWLETGLTAGPVSGSAPGFGWFWADGTPDGTYSEAWDPIDNQGVKDQSKTVALQYLGSTQWNVIMDGTIEATPTNNTGNAGGVQLGAEVYGDEHAQVNAHAWNWKYLPKGGGPWQSVAVSKTGYYPSNPADFNLAWGPDPTTGLLDVTVHTTGKNQQCGDQVNVRNARTAAAEWKPSLASVRQVAASVFAANTSGHAVSSTVVRTTRRAATALTGEDVVGPGSMVPVYLIQETGTFAAQVSSPAGVVTRHGRAIHAVIDALTGQVLDWGIYPQSYNLRSLGTIAALPI